ncbi:MAG: UDP binding domain-containing protein [Desulfobacterales bacterium]|jgi:nucleotide sugar dehydrogenase|nr:UDP binding domain-containing protein [Desulfobacterales bacterium]
MKDMVTEEIKDQDDRVTESVSPDGECFPLPRQDDYGAENQRLQSLVAEQRARGREIVVVMGVGFVGAVMAGVVADSTDKSTGEPLYFVIGMQRPSPRSYWKIPYLNRGVAPVEAEDPEVAPLIARCVNEKKTLTASFSYDALALADIVVVDVQCDYSKNALGNVRDGHAEIKALEESLKVIGEKIAPHCLVLIETTVPPGTTEYVAYPILKKAFEARGLGKGQKSEDGGQRSKEKPEMPADASDHRPPPADLRPPTSDPAEPLLAHSYERVMPGRHYVASIRDFWRVCSGVNPEAREKVVRFLGNVLNVEKFPLTVLDRPIESETAKIVENSYRATILAFLDEWSRFAELNGVDLIKVIEAIKVRPTHDNMIFPGPGIGGYCLPKDGGLGVWAYNTLMGFEDDIFKITPLAIDINDTRSLHVAQLVRDALRNMGRIVAASKVAVLGASYRQDVGDTRYSGSEIIVRKIAEMGGEVVVHDPYVKHWWEFEKQESYPAPGKSWARFFRNQEGLSDLRIAGGVAEALRGVDAMVLAVPHAEYLALTPDAVVEMIGARAAVVDCFGILKDDQIQRYFELGCEVKGLGRGHIQRIKERVRKG